MSCTHAATRPSSTPTVTLSPKRIQSAIWSAFTRATAVSASFRLKSALSSAFASSAAFARRVSSEKSVGCCNASSPSVAEGAREATAALTDASTRSASRAVPAVSVRTTNVELPAS